LPAREEKIIMTGKKTVKKFIRKSATKAPAESVKSVASGRAWLALAAHYPKIKEVHLRTLFAQDPGRGERFTLEAAGLYLDYSKHRLTDETLRLLFRLAEESDLRGKIDAMFRGDKINFTENRAVLHVALRAPRDEQILVDGQDVVPEVHAVRRSWWAARTWFPKSMPSWIRWPHSPIVCEAANGKAVRVNASATWSTSASAARTLAR